jgi:hypothetical protein
MPFYPLSSWIHFIFFSFFISLLILLLHFLHFFHSHLSSSSLLTSLSLYFSHAYFFSILYPFIHHYSQTFLFFVSFLLFFITRTLESARLHYVMRISINLICIQLEEINSWMEWFAFSNRWLYWYLHYVRKTLGLRRTTRSLSLFGMMPIPT